MDLKQLSYGPWAAELALFLAPGTTQHCLQLNRALAVLASETRNTQVMRTQVPDWPLPVLLFWALASWRLDRGMDQAEDLRALFLFSHSLYPQWLLEAYRHTTWPQIDVLKKEKTGKRMTLFFPFSVLTIRWSLGGFASTKGKSSGSVTAVELFELRTLAPGYSHAFYVGD